MERMRSARFALAVASVLVVSALAGGLFGRGAVSSQERLPERYRAFTTAVRLVETNYVEKTESDRVVYSAISGMLQTLDPHSSFLDPRTYGQMRERQQGRYYGLGITIQVIDGDITAVSLFEGSPAYKKGVRRGDVIAKIDGEDAKGWTSEQAARRLRGPKGTTVRVSLRRRGYDQLIDLDVPRDEINMPTIAAAAMLDGTTAYIRLQDFAEQTGNDLSVALKNLSAKGMRRLLLDLRGNPGGPLDQAIRVSNEFLQQGQMIVYTRGRVPNSDQDYRATERGRYTEVSLVVLASRNSASASEIVAGALQDHDRAVVVGETTFGKALVQSVYRISEGAALALTTARYYTPSGRMIQRPVGRHVRRVPDLHGPVAERPARARGIGPQVHGRRAEGVRRRWHRARPPAGRAGRGVQPRPLRPPALRAPGVRVLRAEVSRRWGTRASPWRPATACSWRRTSRWMRRCSRRSART